MAGGFQVSLGFDSREFLRGAGNVADQLDLIREGLEEIGDSGDRSVSDAADALGEIGDEAKDASRSVERAADDMADEISKVGDEAKGVEFDALGDEAKDASRSVERAADDMADEISKVGDEAKTAGKEIGSGIDKGTESAETSVESLRAAAIKKLRDVGDQAKRSGREIGEEIKDGTRRGSEGFEELKDEAGSSGREAAASFSGEFDDITDLIQELAANAFQGFGAAGMIGGIAAGAGIGLITKAIETAREEAERAQARFESMVDALASGDSEAFLDYVNDNMKNIVKSSDDAVVKFETFEKVMEDLNGTGIEQEEVLRALGGDRGAIQSVTEKLDPLIESEIRQKQHMEQLGVEYQGNADALIFLSETLDETTIATDKAEHAADVYSSAVEEGRGQVEKAVAVGRELVEGLLEEHEIRLELADATRNYAQVLADQDDALAEATEAIEENNEAHADQQQLAIENRAVLADLADELLDEADAAEAAGKAGEELSDIKKENYDDFVRVAKAAGFEQDEIEELARDYGLIPNRSSTKFETPGLSDAVKRAGDLVGQLRNTPTNVAVGVNYRASNLQSYMTSLARGVSVTIPVYYRVGSGVGANFTSNWWG